MWKPGSCVYLGFSLTTTFSVRAVKEKEVREFIYGYKFLWMHVLVTFFFYTWSSLLCVWIIMSLKIIMLIDL